MRPTIIIQARLESYRLPGKCLKDMDGKPMIWYTLDRLLKLGMEYQVVLASPDNELVKFAMDHGALGYKQIKREEDDVLKRYYDCAKFCGAKGKIIRVTGDCPLIDIDIIKKCVDALDKQTDYVSNVCDVSNKYEGLDKEIKIVHNIYRTSPKGTDVEVFWYDVLDRLNRIVDDPVYREHVTLFLRNNLDKFFIKSVPCFSYGHELNWSVDTPEDFKRVTAIVRWMKKVHGNHHVSAKTILEEYSEHFISDVAGRRRDPGSNSKIDESGQNSRPTSTS